MTARTRHDRVDAARTALAAFAAALAAAPERPLVTAERVTHGASWRAECACGWSGVLHSNRTIEGRTLAERDAADHRYRHDNGLGWFDYTRGWIPGPNDPE